MICGDAFPDPATAGLQAYVVGGAVRDALLGLPAGDRDWVVVGATPEDMICAWIVTSSAVVGSSAISSLGLQATAMACVLVVAMRDVAGLRVGAQAGAMAYAG